MVETQEQKTEVVRLTDKYHSYRVAHGPQYSAGELVQVSTKEADRLVTEGAAVRISEASPKDSDKEKAPTHPTKDKMVHSTATK